MRGLFAILLVGMLMLPASASEGGVNEAASINGTGIKSLDYENVVRASSGGNFEINLEIENGSNISNVKWVTQICVNTGVCYPPEERQMEKSGNGVNFGYSLEAQPGYSYINWKFILEAEDGSESLVPEVGFGWKVWSDCWFDNGTWGGSETSCKDDDGMIPGFTISLAIVSVGMAALMLGRD